MNKDSFLSEVGSWSNHRILLWLALDLTKDSELPVLEFGAGGGSTPFLSEYCAENNRQFISYENDETWAKQCGSLYVPSWDNEKLYVPCSVCLVDHAPGEHRHEVMAIMQNKADIIVVHDSEPEAIGYMLDKVWSLFKHRINLKRIDGTNGAEASMVSNKLNIESLTGQNVGEEYKITL